jgi:hypothetical protein
MADETGISGQMITRPVKIKLVFIPRSLSMASSPIPGSGRTSPRPPPSPRTYSSNSQPGTISGAGTGEGKVGATRITFRQEKGGEEGFMAVFNQFRTAWGYVLSLSLIFLMGMASWDTMRIMLISRFDSLRSPGMTGSPAFPSPHLSPRAMKGRAEERGLFEEDVAGLGIYERVS